MAQEQMVWLDGKQILKSQFPSEPCFLIHGRWYTEKGLPPELSAYKKLWDPAVKQESQTPTQEKKTTTQSESNTVPAATATTAKQSPLATKTEKQDKTDKADK
jgi:hypothetical protein